MGMHRPFERVYTVNDFFDGPRTGVADFNGSPHVYASRFDSEADDWAPDYRLAPIDGAALSAVREDWAIWCRWRQAFDAGRVSADSHPALPEDRVRHRELAGIVADVLKRAENGSIRALAEFRSTDSGSMAGGYRELEVSWTPVHG